MINPTPRIDKFNREWFENMIDKIVIGQVDENGNENTSFENKNKPIHNLILI